jgi:hypothetical protein
MPEYTKIVGFYVLIGSVISGSIIVASGQVFLAIREIAINTRSQNSEENGEYKTLWVLAKLNNAIGILVMIIGIIVGLLILSK